MNMNVNINAIAHTLQGDTDMGMSKSRSDEIKKEEIATDFEEIFARKLVSELTKDSFKMDDNNGVLGQSNNMYRRHITETLANEIAKQRKLGMADLITEHWKQRTSF
ncbi:hypothetical protein SAMN05443144_1206 [Fodinibius roseus]|uniref:Rod binding protein n=1 Tax=Fodinibius roseus TaxID=1194090 RepID=A0A1M5HD89_9BACT|nr:hypothetical protein [Fodinibius roseus]SHG13897.1 hypothetical protein SAMN05443144_1206 [Fodinibius roseus]